MQADAWLKTIETRAGIMKSSELSTRTQASGAEPIDLPDLKLVSIAAIKSLDAINLENAANVRSIEKTTRGATPSGEAALRTSKSLSASLENYEKARIAQKRISTNTEDIISRSMETIATAQKLQRQAKQIRYRASVLSDRSASQR